MNKAIDTSFLPEINITDLPSKFKAYPEGAEIKYRPYLFGEVKQFSQSRWNDVQRFDFVRKGVTASFDSKDLTLNDLMYIALLRRMSTMASDFYKLEIACDHCDKKGEMKFTQGDLDFRELGVDGLPLVLTLATGEYEMWPLRFRDFGDSFAAGKSDDAVDLLSRMCRNKNYEEVYKAFYSATGIEGDALNEVDDMLVHGLKPLNYLCGACKQNTEVDLEGGGYLLMPFRGDGVSAKSLLSTRKTPGDKPIGDGEDGLRGDSRPAE